jgi:hypothetical protein
MVAPDPVVLVNGINVSASQWSNRRDLRNEVFGVERHLFAVIA